MEQPELRSGAGSQAAQSLTSSKALSVKSRSSAHSINASSTRQRSPQCKADRRRVRDAAGVLIDQHDHHVLGELVGCGDCALFAATCCVLFCCQNQPADSITCSCCSCLVGFGSSVNSCAYWIIAVSLLIELCMYMRCQCAVQSLQNGSGSNRMSLTYATATLGDPQDCASD